MRSHHKQESTKGYSVITDSFQNDFPTLSTISVAAEIVDVVAVLDCRRDPAWIRERLKF